MVVDREMAKKAIQKLVADMKVKAFNDTVGKKKKPEEKPEK